MFLRFHPYYAADSGADTGDDSPDGKIKPSDILNRYGQTAESALRMAEKLAESENANWQLREKNRGLRDDVKALKEKAPADGAVVLSADDAKELEAFRALGKPAELKTALDGAEQATAELSSLRQKQTLHDVQAATGYDPDVLGEIGQGWQYTFKDEQADGKPVKVVYVKEGETETRLDAHPKVQKFMPALRPNNQEPASGTRGTHFVEQHSGGAPAGDKAAQFIQQQEARRKAQPNPLMKQGA